MKKIAHYIAALWKKAFGPKKPCCGCKGKCGKKCICAGDCGKHCSCKNK